MTKRISIKCLNVMRKRTHWRKRAEAAAVDFVTWPIGKPGRDQAERELHKAICKIQQWFKGGHRARLVVLAIQRKAVSAFRAHS